MRLIGFVLVIVGALALGYQQFASTSAESADAAGRQLGGERARTIGVPPVVGGIAVVSGLLLVVTESRRGES